MSRNQPSFTKLASNPGFPFWIEISSKAARQIQKRKSGFKDITETDAIYKLSQKNLAGKFILSNRYCLQLDLHNNTDPKSWPSPTKGLVNYVYKPSPTWVARGIDCCAKEENILSEGGMEDVNGSHPPSSIHEHPFSLRGRKNVFSIPPPQLCFHLSKDSSVALIWKEAKNQVTLFVNYSSTVPKPSHS